VLSNFLELMAVSSERIGLVREQSTVEGHSWRLVLQYEVKVLFLDIAIPASRGGCSLARRATARAARCASPGFASRLRFGRLWGQGRLWD
jgi:DNA-binding LytR/AlgR family response regulator